MSDYNFNSNLDTDEMINNIISLKDNVIYEDLTHEGNRIKQMQQGWGNIDNIDSQQLNDY